MIALQITSVIVLIIAFGLLVQVCLKLGQAKWRAQAQQEVSSRVSEKEKNQAF